MPASTTTTPTPHPPTAESIAATRATHHHLTPSEFETLRARAQAAKARAHCPYSRFRVGAALLTRAGDVVVGANVENASYPVGTCAERVAFGTAVVGGYFDKPGGEGEGEGPVVRALAVATDAEGPASPCGMCRQFIREFCELSMPIIMFDKDSNFIVMKLEELLPLSFGPDNLGAPDPAKPRQPQA